MQEMVPHSLGRTTLLHKSVLPITMIFSIITVNSGLKGTPDYKPHPADFQVI